MAHHNLIYKEPEADLRLRYPKWFEMSMLIGLTLTILLFYTFKRFESGVKLDKVADQEITVEQIPPTQQIQKPPPPAKPKIPVESEDEDTPEDLTIEEDQFDFEQEVEDLPPSARRRRANCSILRAF